MKYYPNLLLARRDAEKAANIIGENASIFLTDYGYEVIPYDEGDVEEEGFVEFVLKSEMKDD
jgi:hypothetical protein